MPSASLVSGRQRLSEASRYELMVRIASGGTASVYVGRLTGSVGFSRLVAIKRAHPHLLDAEETRQNLVDEAVLASEIHHPNVVRVLDVEEAEEELLLIMDYVEGASLAQLLASATERGREVPAPIAVRVLLDACAGLDAVHRLEDGTGAPRGLVHRDVSPQNILVGIDGLARLTDFGLAKLAESATSRTTGVLRGKIAYLPPEYVDGAPFDPQGDVFSMGVVLWETLTNRRLFRGQHELETLRRIATEQAPLVSTIAPSLGVLDAVVARALEKSRAARWPSIAELGRALEAAVGEGPLRASHAEVGAFVLELAGEELERRRALLRKYAAVAVDPSFGDTASLVHEDLPFAIALQLPERPAPPERTPGQVTETMPSMALPVAKPEYAPLDPPSADDTRTIRRPLPAESVHPRRRRDPRVWPWRWRRAS